MIIFNGKFFARPIRLSTLANIFQVKSYHLYHDFSIFNITVLLLVIITAVSKMKQLISDKITLYGNMSLFLIFRFFSHDCINFKLKLASIIVFNEKQSGKLLPKQILITVIETNLISILSQRNCQSGSCQHVFFQNFPNFSSFGVTYFLVTSKILILKSLIKTYLKVNEKQLGNSSFVIKK